MQGETVWKRPALLLGMARGGAGLCCLNEWGQRIAFGETDDRMGEAQ